MIETSKNKLKNILRNKRQLCIAVTSQKRCWLYLWNVKLIFLILAGLLFGLNDIIAQNPISGFVVDIELEENDYIADLKTLDLNNDGADELIILVGSNINYLATYRWMNAEFQQIWSSEMWNSFWVYGMQISDFDNDNKKDILVSWDGTGFHVNWYKNYGAIFIDQGVLLSHCPDEAFCVHDLDGDNLKDIASGSMFANSGFSIQLYKHNSTNHTVQYMGLIPDGTNGSNMVKAIDINGDDKMDILGAEKYSGTLYTYINEGDFNFSQSFVHQFPDRIYSIEVADFNDDELDDFIAAEFNSKIHFFKNLGDGQFSIEYTSQENENWNDSEAADLNGDGKPDLIAQSYKGKINLFKNLGDFNFEEMIYPNSDTVTYNLALGDFDGNGELDLVYGRNPAHVVFDAYSHFVPVNVAEHLYNGNFNQENLHIYPNPFYELFNVETEHMNNRAGTLNIYSQTGEKIKALNLNSSNSITVYANDLETGIYFITLETPEGIRSTKKMIKL